MEIDEEKSDQHKNDKKPVDNDESKHENESNAKTVESTFKKPLLVGKIGRLPKKLINTQTPETQNTESNPVISKNITQEVEIPKPETKTPKTDSFSVQYKEPSWSGIPESASQSYNFEVLKDGSIIDRINLNGKSYWVFGRLANCDIPMQHPTISRYHAVIQYRTEPDEANAGGFYIYDLGSTHGTFLNKNKLRPRVYVRIQVGHILKLGCSSRSYLLNGPEEDTEEESELSVTELKQKRKEELERREREKIEELQRIEKEEEERKKKEEERGIDWGLGEDADEETDLSENPFAQSNNEDLYLDDPKKTLRGFFEREGLNLEYECSEQGMGQFLCKVELPIDDEKGRPIYAEIIHKGKKKEAVVQCALEACRILDRYGLLRQAVHESRKRKAKDWAENDYYDSDDDTFLDRTGEIEKRREKRMNAKNPKKAETYESLMEKEVEIAASIRKVEHDLLEAQEKAKNSNSAPSEEDSLDAFMKDLKDSKPDKTAISKLKKELAKLKQEHAKVIKLVNVAKPASLPPLVPQYTTDSSGQSNKSKVLPVFGKRKKVPVVVQQKSTAMETVEAEDEEEEEEESNEQVSNIEGGDVASEPSKEEQESVVESCRKKSEFGLQRPKEIAEMKSNENDEKADLSFEENFRNIWKGLSEKVDRISESISRKYDPEIKRQKLDNLLSIVKRAEENILQEIERLEAETSDTNEVQIEKSEIDAASVKVENTTDEAARKRKNQRRIQQRQEKAEIERRKGYAEDSKKEDYNMWVPPKGQTGDGKTKLNEKFGY